MGREFNQRMVLTHIPRTLSCHVIHVKKTRSKRITDTVWFKHKYITQPKVTPADQIVKAINDLACALKDKNNVEGLEQMEALQKLEELLTKSPIHKDDLSRVKQEPRVTFEPSVKPSAQSPRVEITEPEIPRIQLNNKQMSINDANIKKSIQNAHNKCTVRVPLARVLARSQRLRTNSYRILQERAQLIHDKETGEYLNY